MKDLVKEFNGLKVLVNPYVEFLGVIFLLADFENNKPRNNDEYLNKMKIEFSRYKNDELVLKFKELLKNGSFKYDAPLEMVLRFVNNENPTKELLQRANINKKEFEKIKRQFFEFYQEVNFEKFIEQNNSEYNLNIDRFIERLKSNSPHEFLFDFLGMKNNNLNVVLMHSVTTSNYGIMAGGQLYCLVRPYYKTRFDSFDFAYDMPYVTSLLLHEFAHSFINPLTDKFLLDKTKINKRKLESVMNEHPYGLDYIVAIYETIIRTIECLYIKQYFNENYEEFKKEYVDEGFTLIEELSEFFEKFKETRKKGETIEKIYPDILKYFY